MVTTVRGGNVQRLSPTGPFEENPKVSRTVAELAKRAKEGGASSIMFLPEKAVRYEAYAFAYHTGLAKEMNIAKAPNGPLRGTVVINISGHASGGINDRVVGWAEREAAKVGVRIGDSVAAFDALRAAANKAAQELSSDYARTKQSVTIDLSGVPGGAGKSVTLKRETFDKMQKANLQSDDDELATLAHYGNEALRKQFAATNTYNVRIRTPDGKTTEMRGIPRNDPSKLEFATRIPVEIPAGTKGEVILEAWPTGSAEVAGYVEARRYKIHVGEGLFDMNKAIQNAEAYQARYPQVRWDTEHESEDIERHHVNPSPYPYQDF